MIAQTTTAGFIDTPGSAVSTPSTTLKDLLEDGMYMQFLLRNGAGPQNASEFNRRIDDFLAQFERHARNFGKTPAAVQECKYAFCALLDEIILSSELSIREEWEGNPLQLRLFGDHLAGENFFEKLEQIRRDPHANIETLEVFHMCLLLGFQGKYLLEGTEKLGYLTGRILQEIITVRGGKTEFAPHWKPPFHFQEFVKHELPMWLFYLLIGLVAILLFIAFTFMLRAQVKNLAQAAEPPASVFAPAPSSMHSV